MTVDFSSITNSDDRDELMELMVEYLIEQLENDVSISRFNTPTDGETVEPNVENIVNATVRNRGTEDQNAANDQLATRAKLASISFSSVMCSREAHAVT